MRAEVLVAGLDVRSLLLEAPLLLREGHAWEQQESARDLLRVLAESDVRLLVLGPRLPDLSLAETVRRIRSSPTRREVSILALLPALEPPDLESRLSEAGVNAALRRPLDRLRLEFWLSRLLAIPRRVEARLPVEGQVLARSPDLGKRFHGVVRNVSVHGMLLASPLRLAEGADVELQFALPGPVRLQALGRVVREASEVGWPYIGYGIEFLFVPPECQEGIARLVSRQAAVPAYADRRGEAAIHSTVRRDEWIYEILQPVQAGPGWQVEIHREARDQWRPGTGGPFYVVEGKTPEEALHAARDFLRTHV
jgi:CheY-like chemotaxis protein